VLLNLREAPSTTSEVLTSLSNGTQMKVVLRSKEWTLVDVGGMNGYLLNDYLEFWTGPDGLLDPEEPDDEDGDGEEEEEYDAEYAKVSCETADKAEVFDEDSDDANVLGTLKNGIQVQVLRTTGGWCHISYQGHEGYMREQDLQFVFDGIAA